jgi:hypothetical protein
MRCEVIGSSVGGGISLANRRYGSSEVDLARYQVTGAIIGGSIGALCIVLFLRDIETVREKYKDKLEEFRRRRAIGLWPVIGVQDNQLSVGLALRIWLN